PGSGSAHAITPELRTVGGQNRGSVRSGGHATFQAFSFTNGDARSGGRRGALTDRHVSGNPLPGAANPKEREHFLPEGGTIPPAEPHAHAQDATPHADPIPLFPTLRAAARRTRRRLRHDR